MNNSMSKNTSGDLSSTSDKEQSSQTNETDVNSFSIASDFSHNKTPNSDHVSVSDSETTNTHSNHNYHFESNRKYFSISVYALSVIFIGTFLVYCIMNMGKTKAAFLGLASALSPFIIAFFIAYILHPIVVKMKYALETWCHIKSSKLSKPLSIILTYLLVLSILTVTLLYIVPELGTTLSELSIKLQNTSTQLVDYLQHFEDKYPNLDITAYEEKISDAIMYLVSIGPNMIKEVFPVILNVSMGIVKLFINLLLSVVISVYMLNDRKTIGHNITRALYAFFKEKKVDTFLRHCKECNHIFSGFIVGKSLDSLIIGIICFILMLILRLPYAVLLSVIVGITNMIPYFGPFIGAIPGVVLFLVISPVKAIIFAIMILALQQFDGLYLGPKILGDSTGLKPLWVIFGITLGGAYFGVLGMFLGVPVVAVIAYLLNNTINLRLKKKNIQINED